MELTDILPLEEWVKLEKEMNNRSGLDANIFDTDGVRISADKSWVNRLCPAIKATDKGQSFICAVAHQNLAAQARQLRRTVIEECDAGMVKMVVPIFIDDEFIGAAGACGLILEAGEIDPFLISKMTDIEEERIDELAENLSEITTEAIKSLAAFTEERIAGIVSAFKAKANGNRRMDY